MCFYEAYPVYSTNAVHHELTLTRVQWRPCDAVGYERGEAVDQIFCCRQGIRQSIFS